MLNSIKSTNYLCYTAQTWQDQQEHMHVLEKGLSDTMRLKYGETVYIVTVTQSYILVENIYVFILKKARIDG